MNEKHRKMRALAEQLDRELRFSVGEEPGYELWVYGSNRSCRIDADGTDVGCDFFIGQAQVARACGLHEIGEPTAAWLLGRPPIAVLPTMVPGVELERHAAVLDLDPARWHWLHLRDRLEDSDDVLAPSAPLVHALIASPVATKFYTYSSLHRLCFSASSHFPWVDEGLPVIVPCGDGSYLVGSERCELAQAVALVEDALRNSCLRPFFGSEPHYEFPLLAELLAHQGSSLRPELLQNGAWFELVVRALPPHSGRYTTGTLQSVFVDETRRLHLEWADRGDAARAIRWYCEDGASLDEIASHPLAQVVSMPNRL